MSCRALLTLMCTLLLAPVLFSQKIDYPPRFLQLMEEVGLDFFEPTDAGYRDYAPLKNPYLNSHLAIRSKKEKMDILFFIVPWDDRNPNASNPNIQTFTIMTNLATNADEATISAIQPTRGSIQKNFNADWGMIYYFKPKTVFSERRHCRMVALCREGKGTVFIFYLFDDAGNEALDMRYAAVRFNDLSN